MDHDGQWDDKSKEELHLRSEDTRDRRPLIFFVVCMGHITVVWLLNGLERQPRARLQSSEAIVLLILPASERPRAAPKSARHPVSALSRNAQSEPIDSSKPLPSPLPPKIDWSMEAGTATRNALSNLEQQQKYRNLAGLSPAQLRWVTQNHFEPAPAGIPWKYRRVEVSAGGFPIIHINDHCVVIPITMMMVFCQIGHIEPDGTLFDHMRDP